MTDIALGQSIAGSTTTNNPSAGGKFFDDYDIKGVDSFRQLKISSTRYQVQLINAATEAVVGSSDPTQTALNWTTFPGVNYKVRVLSNGAQDYTVSLGDGGKATSIVSPAQDKANSGVGTVGESGIYFGLSGPSSSSYILEDVALSSDGQLYGINGHLVPLLVRIDPSLEGSFQYKSIGYVNGTSDADLPLIVKGLEFGADKKLYGLGAKDTKIQFFQLDPDTNKITKATNLPQGLLSTGDLVYDAAKNRFLVTSAYTPTTDALWQIPADNPSGATRIGQIGFTGVEGISFENGQLTGFTKNIVGSYSDSRIVGSRIKIDAVSGLGTLDKAITLLDGSFNNNGKGNGVGISGASTIPGSTTVTTPPTVTNPTVTTPTVITPIVIDTFPTSAANAIGSKSQTLAEGRTIDLIDYAGKILKADTTTKGDAAYNNNIGFYVVEDSIGTIKLGNGSLLKPGDADYAVEAIKSAVLRAAKIDSKSNQDVAGGSIYAPVVVAQGTFDDFVNKNPTNGGDGKAIHAYFNYIGANPDKFDHFQLTGTNTFAVEDMYGGGDKDYNDLVVNMNVRTS